MDQDLQQKLQAEIQSSGMQELTATEREHLEVFLQNVTIKKCLGNLLEMSRVRMQSTSSFNILSDKKDTENFLRAQGFVTGVVTAVDSLFLLTEEEETENEK